MSTMWTTFTNPWFLCSATYLALAYLSPKSLSAPLYSSTPAPAPELLLEPVRFTAITALAASRTTRQYTTTITASGDTSFTAGPISSSTTSLILPTLLTASIFLLGLQQHLRSGSIQTALTAALAHVKQLEIVCNKQRSKNSKLQLEVRRLDGEQDEALRESLASYEELTDEIESLRAKLEAARALTGELEARTRGCRGGGGLEKSVGDGNADGEDDGGEDDDGNS